MKKRITVKTRLTGEKNRREKLTIGLDLGDRSSCYCVLDEQGDVILEGSVATRGGRLHAPPDRTEQPNSSSASKVWTVRNLAVVSRNCDYRKTERDCQGEVGGLLELIESEIAYRWPLLWISTRTIQSTQRHFRHFRHFY
jgi:hypothetical protein